MGWRAATFGGRRDPSRTRLVPPPCAVATAPERRTGNGSVGTGTAGNGCHLERRVSRLNRLERWQQVETVVGTQGDRIEMRGPASEAGFGRHACPLRGTGRLGGARPVAGPVGRGPRRCVGHPRGSGPRTEPGSDLWGLGGAPGDRRDHCGAGRRWMAPGGSKAFLLRQYAYGPGPRHGRVRRWIPALRHLGGRERRGSPPRVVARGRHGRFPSETLDFGGPPVPMSLSVGPPNFYLERPGFWFGATGVAACWFGGASGLAEQCCGASARIHQTLSSSSSDTSSPTSISCAG